MKIRNINQSLAILTVLVVLSFAFFVRAQNQSATSNNIFLDSDQDGLSDKEEKLYGTDPHNPDTDGDGYSDGAEVKSGYDPLKPAPGDKIINNTSESAPPAVLGESASFTNTATTTDSQNNLTKQVAQKISELASKTNQQDQQVTVDEISSMVDNALNSQNSTINLPEINKNDIKIKKQDYSKLSTDEATAKKRDDFLNYIAAVSYIMSSNSPKPITSTSDITSIISQMTQEIISSINDRNLSSVADISQSGDKIMEQLKEVEVPEDLLDLHIKALSYAQYAQQLKQYINPTPDDPLGDIANFSRLEAFVESLSGFYSEVQDKFSEYGITYDEALQNKLKSYGVGPIQVDSTTTDTATTNDVSNTSQ